jgi:FMN phosphatase YigB (HAD superfamily)
MVVYTVDLDDTLRYTQEHEYDATRYAFATWLEDSHGIARKDGIETQSARSSDLFAEYGLSRHRFPEACRQACTDLLEDPERFEEAIAYEIGRSVFGDEQYYQDQGMVDGAEDVLETLSEEADELILLTAGDPVIQQRKIDGLDLQQWFDDCRIVDEKATELRSIVEETDHRPEEIYHIGNSERSDVKAAQEAGVNAVHVAGGSWELDETSIDGDVRRIEDLTDLLDG